MARVQAAALAVALAAVLSVAAATTYPHCHTCTEVLSDIDGVLRFNATTDVIELIAYEVCDKHDAFGECHGDPQCKTLCYGMVHEFGPEVVQILTGKDLNSAAFCAGLGLCTPVHGTQPWYNKTIVYQDLAKSGDVPPPAGDGTFAHISDVHVDDMYSPGSNSQCGLPLCCRAVNGPGNATTAAGPFGNYACDAPWPLFDAAVAQLGAQSSLDFVLWTGDVPPHNIWNQSRSQNLAAADNAASKLQSRLPHLRFFPTLGNHASYPVNQYRGPPYDWWLYGRLADLWKTWLPESALETFRYGGFYTALASPKLRIISLNTNYYLEGNFWLAAQNSTGADIAGQLVWLQYVLEQADARNEQVYIIGHSPPGLQGSLDAYTSKFQAIVQRYADTISGQFYGHTHMDHFEVGYGPAPDNYPTQVMYISPSVTPFTNINPSWRAYDYDVADAQHVTELYQHRTNLEEDNKAGAVAFSLAYTASTMYGMADLTAASWNKVAMDMLNSSAVAPGDASMQGPYALTCSFLNNKYTGRYNGPDCHTAATSLHASCELRTAHYSLYEDCVKAADETLLAAVKLEGYATAEQLWVAHRGPRHC